MAVTFFLNSYVLAKAKSEQTALALAVVKLIQEGFPTPTPDSIMADLDAAEADYDGYAPEAITAWLDPVAAVGGGYRITAPTVQFGLDVQPAAGNAIVGYWIETATGTGVMVRLFDAPVAMVNVGNSVQVNPTITIPNGS